MVQFEEFVWLHCESHAHFIARFKILPFQGLIFAWRASGETPEVHMWAVSDVKVEGLVSTVVNLLQFITLWSRWPGKRNKKGLLPASVWNLHTGMSPPWHVTHRGGGNRTGAMVKVCSVWCCMLQLCNTEAFSWSASALSKLWKKWCPQLFYLYTVF